MGRKNSRAVKPRLKSNGRAHGFSTAPAKAPSKASEPPIEAIIVPTGKCGRKLRFPTEQQAQAALKEARKSHRNPKYVEKRYYLCPRCKDFHLTSMERAVNNGLTR